MLKLWHCRWSGRKSCCRCLKRAGGTVGVGSCGLCAGACHCPAGLSGGDALAPTWCPAPWSAMMMAVTPPVSSGPLWLRACGCRSKSGSCRLLGAVAGLLELAALWLHPDWPGLCLLAHKRTEKRMMIWRTSHNTERLHELGTA